MGGTPPGNRRIQEWRNDEADDESQPPPGLMELGHEQAADDAADTGDATVRQEQ